MRFTIRWHQEIHRDLKKIPHTIVQKMVFAAEQRLSEIPQIIGDPVKGSMKKLWKLRYSKYRIIYTINTQSREVWVLCAQKRDIVYDDENVEHLMRLAYQIDQKNNQK